jgi:hypothetical protein
MGHPAVVVRIGKVEGIRGGTFGGFTGGWGRLGTYT